MITLTTHKTSISLTIPIWNKLKNIRNRSSVINKALDFYFTYEDSLKQAEQDYWQKIEKSLRGHNDEYFSINPNQETITPDLLEKKLWN
jgi:hypothetical protein